MAESIASGEDRIFWMEAKRLNCKSRSIPATTDGSCGEEVAAEVFAHKHKRLYNIVSCTKDNMDNLMAVVAYKVEHCGAEICSKDNDVKL